MPTDLTPRLGIHLTNFATEDRGDWSHLEPAEAGFDPAALDALAAEAEAGGSNCFLVTRHGSGTRHPQSNSGVTIHHTIWSSSG